MMMQLLHRMSPAWRCRVLGFAVGAPLGILIGGVVVWISR